MREKASDNVLPIGSGRWTYTKEDFLTGKKPYEELFALKDDPFRQAQTAAAMKLYAESVGVKKREFDRIWNGYRDSLENVVLGVPENYTKFSGQEMELYTGQWIADDNGVGDDKGWACSHPIMPVERLVNVDTGTHKVKLAFAREPGNWLSVVTDMTTISSKTKIVELANAGISVNSETAPHLIKYLNECVDRNIGKIPLTKSVGRLGDIKPYGFVPYIKSLTFDGDANFRDLFKSVTPSGNLKEWIAIAKECRKMSVMAKTLLAASFASPLLEILGTLPFFVHLWGDTETGKTVALRLAASVWGNPDAYIQTFNGTAVGYERTAAFLNHLPLCLDELQLSRDSKGQTKHDVYKLAEGIGKTRGNRHGGAERTPRWRLIILTTGESPLNSYSAGGGAVNRVIDIECREKVITDGARVVPVLQENYGLAGKLFIDTLFREASFTEIRSTYMGLFRKLSELGATEKQAMAAAAILVADALISGLFFDNENPLTDMDILPFLATKEDTDIGLRAYKYLQNWVAIKRSRFENGGSAESFDNYGSFSVGDGCTYIIRNVCDDALKEGGFDPRKTYSWMKQHGKIKTRENSRAFTVSRRINGQKPECICLLDDNDMEELESDVPDAIQNPDGTSPW